MTTSRSRHALAALSLALCGPLLAGCSGDQNVGPSDSRSTPASSPFASSLTGDETGEPGDTMTETLTNKGRLPDAYQVVIEPTGAATLDEANFHLAPGESATVKITVVRTPFEVHLKSSGGGAPDVVALTVD